MKIPQGTIVVWSDIACPWATLAVHRLRATRARMGLDDGLARHQVIDQWRTAVAGPVKGSPHLFLPDGSDEPNPGIAMHWEGEHGSGFPVVDRADASVYERLLERVAS